MIVRSDLRLARSELTQKEWRRLFQKLTFFDADRNEVKAYQILKGGTVRLHRGAWALLPDHIEYVDKRVCPPGRSYKNTIKLDAPGFEGQVDAFDNLLTEEQGLMVAQPGFGKTQVLLALVAQVKTPSIVFVHTKDIFDQWMQYARKALPDIPIGHIAEGAWNVKYLTIAMVQSVGRDIEAWKHHAPYFGAVIVDEAHHSPADTWEAILTRSPARYRIGATATESRADGLHPLMRQLIGPVVYKAPFSSKVPVTVVPLKSGFKVPYRGMSDWGQLQTQLSRDEKRNRMIATTARREIGHGQKVLVLSRRIEHLENINEFMGYDYRVKILTGKTKRAERTRMINQFRAGKLDCILSTQLADEALDVPILSRVILTYPGKHDGRIIQQIGRALREHPDKTEAIIYDVVDDRIGVLRRQWMQRKQTYKKLKISVKKYQGEEVPHGTEATKRRLVAHRVRSRLAKGRRARS